MAVPGAIDPRSYVTAVTLLSRLPVDLAELQRKRRVSNAQVAKVVGVSAVSYAAVFAGSTATTQATVIKCLRWLSNQP